jgi:hypothetical protein
MTAHEPLRVLAEIVHDLITGGRLQSGQPRRPRVTDHHTLPLASAQALGLVAG